MAEITTLPSGSPTMEDFYADMSAAAHNPTALQRLGCNFIDEITAGAVNLVDPTNPFIMMLEMFALGVSAAVDKSTIAMRAMYPKLAVNYDDLYRHMTDKDYIDVFSSPLETKVIFAVLASDVINKMVYSASEDCWKSTIARDTEISVDGLFFTLQYPVDIRKYQTGQVQITYDATLESPVRSLSTNVINASVRTDSSGLQWIVFEVDAMQYQITSKHFTVDKSKYFSVTVDFPNKFYYARVFYRNNSTNNLWSELSSTHSDIVFDELVPTALFKLYDSQLSVQIPPIYISKGLISGELRVDVYTTKGELTANLSSYQISSFTTNLKSLDKERDANAYTQAFSELNFYTYASAVISGGTNGLSFDQLRDRCINSSLGVRKQPITNLEVKTAIESKGMSLVTNVDVVTNRIFLATRKLPKPLNEKLLTAANAGVATLNSTFSTIGRNASAVVNNNRLTIRSGNLFKKVNALTELIPLKDQQLTLTQEVSALVSDFNKNDYLYNPFYYVLDKSGSEFALRAYDLDSPQASSHNFVYNNETLQLLVNTGQYTLSKTPNGYKLTIVTASGSFYKQLEDSHVSMLLAYTPNAETEQAYIKAVYEGRTSTQERIFSFNIETNHDINDSSELCLTNTAIYKNLNTKTYCSLDQNFDLYHTTSSLTDHYKPSPADQELASYLLPDSSATVTKETIKLCFGYALSKLWSRSKLSAPENVYETYSQDEYATYERDVYESDPVTGRFTYVENGQIKRTRLHRAGEFRLTDSGEKILAYKKGQVKLDAVTGLPILKERGDVSVEIDLLLVDAKYLVATDRAYVDYRKEYASIIRNWVTQTVPSVQVKLLEQTKIFLYPNGNLGSTNVNIGDNQTANISTGQSFTVTLYVNSLTYSDKTLKSKLTKSTVSVLDNFISQDTVNLTQIQDALLEAYNGSVKTLEISKIEQAYPIVTVTDSKNKLMLAKKLTLQQDGSTIVEEDVTVIFKLSA